MPILAIIFYVILGVGVIIVFCPLISFLAQAAFAFLLFFLLFKFVMLFSKMF